MFPAKRPPSIPLPRGWSRSVKGGILHVISLARYAIAYTRGWAANSVNTRMRLKAENDQLCQEASLLREEIRTKDARMARIDPCRRPHYAPTERLAILELKAARGWSLEQTAKAFLVTAATIASWMARLDEGGPDALLQTRTPVNRFPDLVLYVVQRLKVLCPSMGKAKIAETLARAGLHLGVTTVGRMLKGRPQPVPEPAVQQQLAGRVVTSKYPNHLWMVDLTTVPAGLGFWCSWLPFALPQRWPFCWWLALAVDHFSRRVMGFAVFESQPSSRQVRVLLGRAMARAGRAPRHLVCDKGRQFWCPGFKTWCKRRGVKPRFGAVHKHGSIAVIERLISTTKRLLRLLPHVPLRRRAFRREVACATEWYNQYRPHSSLAGCTPDERYFGRFPANRKPRFEPRNRWPRGSPCAKPWALVRGKPGAQLELEVGFHAGRRHLPVVRIKRAA